MIGPFFLACLNGSLFLDRFFPDFEKIRGGTVPFGAETFPFLEYGHMSHNVNYVNFKIRQPADIMKNRIR